MKLLKLMLVVSIIGFSTNSDAVTVAGDIPCATWGKHYDKQTTETRWETIAEKFWLNGYLSGIAVTLDKDILKGTTMDSRSSWMDNYCKSNPLSSVSEGGDTLAKKLIKEMR